MVRYHHLIQTAFRSNVYLWSTDKDGYRWAYTGLLRHESNKMETLGYVQYSMLTRSRKPSPSTTEKNKRPQEIDKSARCEEYKRKQIDIGIHAYQLNLKLESLSPALFLQRYFPPSAHYRLNLTHDRLVCPWLLFGVWLNVSEASEKVSMQRQTPIHLSPMIDLSSSLSSSPFIH